MTVRKLRPLLFVLAGSIFLSVVLLLTGNNPLKFFLDLIRGSLGSASAISYTLQYMTPLLYTGLAAAIAFRSGIFNIGVEGQLYIGALFSALAGCYLKTDIPCLHFLFTLAAAMAGGALWALIPALLKVHLKVNEVISTIMMNYIALNLCNFLVMETDLRVDKSLPFTKNILPSAGLSKIDILSPETMLNTGFLIGIALCLLFAFIFSRTAIGFKMNITGRSVKAASYAGIDVKKIIIRTMLISGAVAGLGGFEQIAGVFKHFVSPFPDGYGYLGIAVSLMAFNNPLFVILTAFLFGMFDSGSSFIDIISNVPREIIYVIEGMIIILVSSKIVRKGGEYV